MNPTYLFEAGSTKTTLLIHKDGKIVEHNLPGFNPNRYSEDFEIELKAKIEIEKDAKIFFYGSGLVEEENKKIVKELIYNLYKISAIVYDDVTGAARAMLGDTPGLIAVMGTGGVAAYYDGQKIVKRNGGYGYLVDDYGGGLELGKIILSKWLNSDLPVEVDTAISEFLKIKKSDFILELYRSNDLKILASVVKIIPAFLKLSYINEIVNSYFNQFFERHVTGLIAQYPSKTIAIVGSIGINFKSIIEVQAAQIGLAGCVFTDKPADFLLQYHIGKTTI